MRIAIVIDSLQMGGAQKLVTTFASAASTQQIKPTIVSLHEDFEASILDSIQSNGVTAAMFPSRSLLDLGRLGRLIRFFRQEKFDLIHTHLSYANILGCVAGYITKIPVVATLHSTGHDLRQFPFHVTFFEKICLRYLARRIVAVGYSIAEAHQNRLGGRIVDVIPNGVPVSMPLAPEIRQRLRREISGDESRLVIVSVGRFVQAKGHQDMLEAFVTLHRNYPQAVLVLVGTGRLFDQIKNKVSNFGIEDSVICLGQRNDVVQLLSASDIYVSSSHREGLPLAVLEAMMAGLPIVGTAVGDVPRIVLAETGVIVPPHEPARLAEALGQLISSPEKMHAMGKAARSRALKEYSLIVWMGRLAALYKETLNSSKG
jgi:glycosyltransferase involved in cell wall biosynthesis